MFCRRFHDPKCFSMLAALAVSFFLFGCGGDVSIGDDDQDDDETDNDDDQADDDLNDDSDDDSGDDDIDDDANDDVDDDIDDDVDDDDDLIGDEFAIDPPDPSNAIGVFVSIEGVDLNPGTMESPKRTIQAGVNLAEQSAKVVFVSEGLFIESVETLVSMYGGYNRENWIRDINLYKTRLHGLDEFALSIGTDVEPLASVTIDGFNIKGPLSGYYSCGLMASHSEVILLNNDIRSQLVAGDYTAFSYGVVIGSETSLKMKNNYVQAGAATAFYMPIESIGLKFEGQDAIVVDNFIYGGNAIGLYSGDSGGIYTRGSGRGIFMNNVIASGSGGMEHYGIRLRMGENDDSLIIHNMITSKGDGIALGIYSPAVIVNNILNFHGYQGSIGIYFYQPMTLMHNDFLGEGPLMQSRDRPFESMDEINNCQWSECVLAGGNIAADPQLAGQNNYHLTQGSPCIDAGVDPSSWYDGVLVDRDFDGDTRPQGGAWDIGVDEYR
jgi:hypothetical protein